jgi:alpha-L-arabinofuranosidase
MNAHVTPFNAETRSRRAAALFNRKFAANEGGMAKRWIVAGEGTTASLDDKNAYAGKTSLRVSVAAQATGGIFQQGETLCFREDTRYRFRWWLKSDASRKVRMRITDAQGNTTLFETENSIEPGEWRLWSGEFATASEAANAKLELTSKDQGVFWVGAVSVQPADAFHGMRRDVIESLRQIKPGSLRFPGGCYAEFYRWQDGLLPVDQRPPIGPTGLDFLLRDSDDIDNQELGIDEFMALCRELGCESSLTLRLSESTPEDAAAWVEYCNGGADTKWGRIRAKRGQSEPYGVKTWFLGNELYFFGRGGMNDPDNCARQSAVFAKAVKKTDPSIRLIGCTNLVGGNNNAAWNTPLLAAAGDMINGISFHDYMQDSRKPGNLKEFATASTDYLRPALQKFKHELGKPVLFDEWNTLWGKPGSLGMGLYAAGVLNLLCREAESLNVEQALFFQPVTEGCITVTPMGSEPDEVGKVFAALGAHQGNRLLKNIPERPADADLDLTASLSPDGKQITVTVINRNSAASHTLELSLANFRLPSRVKATLLSPIAPDPQSKFNQSEMELRVEEGRRVSISLPPCSVACLRLGPALQD